MHNRETATASPYTCSGGSLFSALFLFPSTYILTMSLKQTLQAIII